MFESLTPQARGQAEAWAIGNQRVDMLGTQAPFPVTALPQHPLSEEFTYHGEVASRSQFVHTDGACQLVMFGVDGNIYDKDGYLIADADDGGQNCEQCVEPGVMEMLAIPVPEACGLYYILTSATSFYGADVAAFHVGLLDLGQPNVYHPARWGRMLDVTEVDDLHPTLVDWSEQTSPGNSEYDRVLILTTGLNADAPMLRMVRTGEGYWLYAVYDDVVVQCRLSATGVEVVPAIGADLIPIKSTTGLNTNKSYQRDASVSLVGNEVRLALTDMRLYAWPQNSPDDPSYGVLVMRFNAQTGALLGGQVQGLDPGQDGYPDLVDQNYVGPSAPGLGQAGPAACAWVANGSKLLITGREVEGAYWEPAIAEYDMATATWTDLLPVLNIQGTVDDYVRSRAQRNTAPGGTGEAIYLPHPAGIAAITGVDDGTYAFTPIVSTSSACIPPVLDADANGLYEPHFINAQVTGDNSVAQYTRAECCALRATLEGHSGYTFPNIPGSYHWYAGDNPFGNCASVLFTGDLVIPSDVDLQIHDMTLRFGPQARMIVRERGYATATNCYLTNEDCLGPRWPGIRVEGDPEEPLQSETLQGRLHLYHTTVDDAEVGAWCGNADGFGRTGGIIRTYWSTFRDCIVGARIGQYHRIINATEQNNKCAFYHTAFEVTASWPDLGDNLPEAQIHLFDVNGVAITRCGFSNVYPESSMAPHDRGVGILSFKASYRCKGYQDYANNRFDRLHVGVLNIWNDPLFACQVDGMHFDRNLVGLYDMGCTFSMVTNNKFTTMTSTAPSNYLSMGMYVDQSVGYLVERNYFEDIGLNEYVPSAGIWFHGDQPAENRIYDNEFHDLALGNVAEGVHNGTSKPGGVVVKTGLQWLCGLYEGGMVDQFLLSPDGTISLQQGSNDLDNTAGNVFVGAKDCQSQFEPVVFSDHASYVVTYHYYANDQSPDCRPECVEDDQGTSITATGDYYNLAPVLGDQQPFDATQHCHGGILDAVHKSVQEHQADYGAKYAQLASTALACAGQLDNGEKVEVLEAINAEPPWPSHQLRGYLLAKTPLSEEAIIAAIKRTEPMDPWHLTQVLIANSRLSGAIWAVLDQEDALTPFFYNMVLEHQEDPSFREALMEELDLRAQEKDMEQRLLVLALHEDSTYAGKLDTLLNLFMSDTLGMGTAMAYPLALTHGRSAELAVLEGQLAGESHYAQMLALGQLYTATGYDWMQADTAAMDSLGAWAASGTVPGRGAAWGVWYALGGTDSLPTGILPMEYRAAWADEVASTTTERSVVGAYPNPAHDRLMITYPGDLTGGTLEVTDGQGRSVLSQALGTRTGFVELNVRGWSTGLYLARVLCNGELVGEVKCTITR